MDAVAMVVLVGLLDPVRWVLGALAAWFVPHRWGAVAVAALASLVLTGVVSPHAPGAALVSAAAIPAVIAFVLATWRQRRRTARVPAPTAPDPPVVSLARLAPRKAESHHQVLEAAKHVGPVKQIVRDAVAPLQASGLFDVVGDDLAGEVIGHLLAFHAAVVFEHPHPLPLAAFALGRSVAVGFDAPHGHAQQRACAIALGEVLKATMTRIWPEGEKELLGSATEAFFAWDRQPSRLNLGPAFN